MPKIKNMGTATMRFGEGIIVSGSAGIDTHALVVTGSTSVVGDITCNNISVGADAVGTGRTISSGNTDTSIRFNANDGIDLVVGGTFMISCDENASQDTVVINEGSNDVDFRIESDNNSHHLYSDAGNDFMLINSDTATPGGMGSDTSVFVSGSKDGQGQAVFGGNVVISGSLVASGLSFPAADGSANQVIKTDGSGNLSFVNQSGGGGDGAVSAVANGANNRVATFSASDELNGEANLNFDGSVLAVTGALGVYANISDYAVIIDNDQGSSGHGLKVTSDGTGSGTNLFDVESASTTVLRVRGDGRVGVGKVTSLPAAQLTVSSSNADSDLAIAHKIHHIGDSDTSIKFDDNLIGFETGGSTQLEIDSDGVNVAQYIKHIGDADTLINFADNKIVLKAGNLALVTAEKNSSSPHEVTINDGGNNVDFVVKGNGSNQGNPGMKFDASTNKLGINGIGTPAYELEVAGDIGLAEYIYHRGDDNTYIRFQDDDINLQCGGKSMIKMSEGSIDQVLIMSGGAGSSPNVKDFTDTNFFVSGSIGSKGTTTAGTSVFGGDLVVSGNTRFHNHVIMGGTSDSRLYFDSFGIANGPYIGGNTVALTIDGDNRILNYFDDDVLFIDEQSNSVLTLIDENEGTSTHTNADANIIFSGSIGSKGTSVRGTSIFGGDVVTSGSLRVSDAFTLPTTDGSDKQVLSTNGAGSVTWESVGGGPLVREVTFPNSDLDLATDGINQDVYAVDCNGGTRTVTLPAPGSTHRGKQVTFIKNAGVNTLTITAGTNNIFDQGSATTNYNITGHLRNVTLVCLDYGWIVIAEA